MSSSQKSSAFKTAVTSLINKLIGDHDGSSSAHSTLFNGKANSSHTHGSVTNDGKIGTESGKIITTGTNGVLQASTSITKSKISDFPSTMTPASHSHGSLSNSGALNSDISSVNKIVVTDSNNNLKTISNIPYSKISGTPDIDSSLQYRIRAFTISNNIPSAESYNFNIDDPVCLIVDVFDIFGNQLNASGSISIDIIDGDGNSSTVSTSDTLSFANGKNSFYYIYTANTWGVCKVSVKTYSTHINVSGWKQLVTNNHFTVSTDGNIVEIDVNSTTTYNVSAWAAHQLAWGLNIPTKYYPKTQIISLMSNALVSLVIGTDGVFTIRNNSPSTQSPQLKGLFYYKI